MTTRRVLHVLPHAGAGAQTYIDVLAALDGCSFEIFELSSSRSRGGAAASIAGRQPGLARAASRADLVHVHGEVAGAIALPWLLGRPSVVTLHGLHLLRRLSPGFPQQVGRWNLRAIVAAAGQTICVSEAEMVDLLWLPARLRSKLVVVRNGLELPPAGDPAVRSRARAALGLSDDGVAVLYLGQLEPRKDPLTAVRAVERARAQDERIVLLVAGDGPCRIALQSHASHGAHLLGQRRDVDDLLAASDLFVMPSLREGLSYAVLEALGHGLATVVSDAPGNPEAVGSAGLVFAAGDEEQLAGLLLDLARDPELRRSLGEAGRARIADQLSASRMLEGTAAVYDAVLRGPARARV